MGTVRQGEHLLGLHLRLWFCSALFLHGGNSSVPEILPSPCKHIWKEKTSHLPNCHKTVPQAHGWASVGSLQGEETQTRTRRPGGHVGALPTSVFCSSGVTLRALCWALRQAQRFGSYFLLLPLSPCFVSPCSSSSLPLCLSLSFPPSQSLPPSLPLSLLSPYPHLSPSVLCLSLSTSIFLGKSNAASSYSTSPF